MGYLYDEESRKPIKESVKKEVYKRAKGCCECCGIQLEKIHGDFHHWRSPTISPTAKTVQFLCPTCHRKYGHTRKTVTRDKGRIFEEKEVEIIRHKVKRRKKPEIQKKTAKKKTLKKRPKKKVIKKPKRKAKMTTKKKKTTKKAKTKTKKSSRKKTIKKKTIKKKGTRKKIAKKKTTKRKTKHRKKK